MSLGVERDSGFGKIEKVSELTSFELTGLKHQRLVRNNLEGRDLRVKQ